MTPSAQIWMDLWRKQDFKRLRDFRSNAGWDEGYSWDPLSLLFVARKWHLAGSEVATQRWALDLVRRGYRTGFCDVRQLGTMPIEQLWSYGAVVSATAAGLLAAKRLFGYGAFGPRLVGMVHTHPSDDDPCRMSDLVISNTEAEQRPEQALSVVTLHPPVYRFFDATVKMGANAVVQVNLDRRHKNPGIFYYLAARFPNRRFIAVKGVWGEQVCLRQPNVEIRESGPLAVQEALSEAAVLLCPSTKESYGMVSAEALSVGVPVIASDGVPGLKEALGDAALYVSPEDHEGWARALGEVTTQRREIMQRVGRWTMQAMQREHDELDRAASRLHELIAGRQG